MEQILLPVLIAGAVACIVLGLWYAFGSGAAEKRRLHQRLSTERPSGLDDALGNNSVFVNTDATGFDAVLVQYSPLASLRKLVTQGYPDMTLARFLTIAGSASFLLGMMFLLWTGQPIVGLVAAGLGAYVPFFLLAGRRSKRQRAIELQLPEALDFLGRIMRAGHSLSTGIQMMGEELPAPLAAEFRKSYEQHSLGTPLEDCLKNMVQRIESTDFAFFITAVLIQRQTGGDLSQVLGNISGMIRQRIRLQQHVKAKTAEGRFSGYVLICFPVVMFLLMNAINPKYASVLLNTRTGITMLLVAGMMVMVGLFAIRKLTVVRV